MFIGFLWIISTDVIFLYCYMSSIDVCMVLFKTKTYREALSLYIGISGLNINTNFTGNGFVVWEEYSAKTILTGIGIQDKGLCVVIICQSGPEMHVANSELQAIKSLICGGVSFPICYCSLRKVVLGARPGREGCK